MRINGQVRVMDLFEKCPVLKEIRELNPKAAAAIQELLGPEECIKYCYYTSTGPSEAEEIERGVFFERRRDLGVHRIYVYDGKKWILFEEEPC